MSNVKSILASYAPTIEQDCGAFKRLQGCQQADDALHVPVDRIDSDPNQPRQAFDEEELYTLAGSLRARGQLQPIRVRYDGETDRYIVIAGERRLRAARIAELETIQCIVDNRDPDRLVTQLAENLQRSSLTPIEEAHAFREIMKTRKLNGKQLAEVLNLSEAKVSRSLSLLDLPEDVQRKVDAGEIKGREAREIARKRPPRPRKRSTTRTIRVGHSQVVVTIAKKQATDEDVAGVLEEAAKQIRGSKRKAA